jgi:hypothetical protein
MSDNIDELPAKVALFSSKSIFWAEVGRLNRGYTIVSKDQALRWLERKNVRIATPEEVAKEFAK